MGPFRRLVAALALIGAGAAGAIAQPVELTPDEMRRAGYVSLSAGAPAQALSISEALLGRDDGDVVALILKSRALRALGRDLPAQAAARQAWAAAGTDEQRYGAALAMAQALSSAGARTRAQLWLRRAIQVAPTPLARTIAIRDFGYVRSRNPLSFHIDMSAAPSSNVNGGSSSATTELLGLPFVLSGDARALSGYEAALGVTARLRLPGARAQSELRFSAQGSHYWLTDAAQAQAPEAEGSDYDFAAVELGWSTRRRPGGGPVVVSYGATLGRNWYGGAALSNYLRLDAGLERELGSRTLAQLRGYTELQRRLDDDDRSARLFGLTAALVRQADNGDRLRFSLGLRDTASDASSVAHTAVLGGIEWDKAKPVGGVRIAAGLGFETRDYPTFPFVAGGREDIRLNATLSLTFDKIEYYGFSPVLTLNASQTWSGVDLYDSNSAGITFGFRSRF